jgi:hypothetical protein
MDSVAVRAAAGLKSNISLARSGCGLRRSRDAYVQEMIGIAGQNRSEQERRRTCAAVFMDTVRVEEPEVEDRLEDDLATHPSEGRIRESQEHLLRADPMTFGL